MDEKIQDALRDSLACPVHGAFLAFAATPEEKARYVAQRIANGVTCNGCHEHPDQVAARKAEADAFLAKVSPKTATIPFAHLTIQEIIRAKDLLIHTCPICTSAHQMTTASNGDLSKLVKSDLVGPRTIKRWWDSYAINKRHLEETSEHVHSPGCPNSTDEKVRSWWEEFKRQHTHAHPIGL